jgi:CheY-like chemotaxis protein
MSKTIVLVENETKICDYLEQELVKKGNIVEKAYGLVEALNILANLDKTDFLILDVMMEAFPNTGGVAQNAGLKVLNLYKNKLQEIKKPFPRVIVFTAVKEIVPEAKKHPLVTRVIEKKNGDWVDQLIDAVKD